MFTKSEIDELNAKLSISAMRKSNVMSLQEAYESAIAMGAVQAAKVFKKKMNAQLAELNDICEGMMVATAGDYAALDNLVSLIR